MGKKAVAIIDDEPDIAAFLEDLLVDEGYEPVLWERGAGAYEFIKRTMPAAILLDMSMETRDAGLNVAAAVCEDPETHHIPIIILSAGTEFVRNHSQRLEELGCTTHPKPVDIAALLSLLAEVTEVRRWGLQAVNAPFPDGAA